jgi:hypothetical protein
MTYIEDKDPDSLRWLSFEELVEKWDAENPDWRELSLDPEVRRFVSENDITE